MDVSGGIDSTGSQNYAQWALNPAVYQNSGDQTNVDWAALAQQWIIMKEAGHPVPEQATTSAPPPTSKPKKDDLNEGGEAPMDVESEREEDAQQWNDSRGAGNSWNWNQQQQWGWNNTWSAPPAVPPPNTAKAPLLPTPTPFGPYAPGNDSGGDDVNYSGFNTGSPGEYSGGYWTANSKLKPHNKRYSKINVPRMPTVPETVTLDANKRKQLPAWIREGLEKMERDKQKQMDREREKFEKQQDDQNKVKLSEKDALEIIKHSVKEQEKSKFDSNGEESESEIVPKSKKSSPVPMTSEEKMLKVRHTMTEILLNVTNREIYQICKEELQRRINKTKATAQCVPAPSGTNVTAKLGLGIYADSESTSGTSDDDSDDNNHDTDAELKDTIKKRKAEFSKTEREIEERLADVENKEEPGPTTPKSDERESQVDAKHQGRKSRFSTDENAYSPKASQYKHKSSSKSPERPTDKKDKHAKSHVSSSGSKYKKTKNSTSERKNSKSESEQKNLSESSSKSNHSQSRRSRSRSRDTKKNSIKIQNREHSKRNSRSRSRSRKSRRSTSRSRRSRSSSYRSRSYYRNSTSRRSYRSRSRSRSRRSRRSSSRSRSSSVQSRKYRRSRSHSSSRGKRSHRH